MNQENLRDRNFEEKKTVYFSRLALDVLGAMKLHQNPGLLWEKNEGGKRDWGNVSEHCLVEVARVKELAKKVGFSPAMERELEQAAALHDFDKRLEMTAMKAAAARGESEAEASNSVDKIGEEALQAAGFSQNVIDIAGSVGGKLAQLFEMTRILGQAELTELEVARLIMHYVDGYTRDDKWVWPMAVEKDGETTNEVDRRTEKNLENPKYRKIDQELKPMFANHPILEGHGPLENEGIVCHLIEKRLVEVITQRTGETINSLELPQVVDEEIRKRIEEVI